jgi:hypothetical protein
VIQTREEILQDIIRKGKNAPKGWQATYRYDPQLHATEYNILHPAVGLYQIKEWQKNPYETQGVGTKIARRIDENLIDTPRGNFGVIKYNPRKILEYATQGKPLQFLLEDALSGIKQKGIEIALSGKMHNAPDDIPKKYKGKQQEIDREIKKMQEVDGLYNSYC